MYLMQPWYKEKTVTASTSDIKQINKCVPNQFYDWNLSYACWTIGHKKVTNNTMFSSSMILHK